MTRLFLSSKQLDLTWVCPQVDNLDPLLVIKSFGLTNHDSTTLS
jgi:hypothetical protein